MSLHGNSAKKTIRCRAETGQKEQSSAFDHHDTAWSVQ